MISNAGHYAAEVREWATRRRIANEARKILAEVNDHATDAATLANQAANRFASVRDAGADDIGSITLGELLAEADDEPDWVLPGLLERRDRFMLTGAEGMGKSHFLRQIAICSAAGLDPFTLGKIRPCSVLIVDCENSLRQIKRRSRQLVDLARARGSRDPGAVNVLTMGRIDLLRERDLSKILHEVDQIRPDILVIGPLYAMSPKALMTDDDAVPVLAALDQMRETGAALLMEAHAGHATGSGGERNFRPRGSSSLLGWPEFGYGMKPVAQGYADLVPWRGDRDRRNWPDRIQHDPRGAMWVPTDRTAYEAESPTWQPFKEDQ